ncbi:hypothetical protein C5F50_10040 [Nitrosopumilus ureiphilus]|uniref:Uncharacterized protein n=1 Tax=Nitrosopumilus ureiphilus TaxID=1470067 RepID=A0A7D5M6R6_9ARCH|nr:hypothetical protein C5F50_10040 [Nitrosopumilus ureiphilus]
MICSGLLNPQCKEKIWLKNTKIICINKQYKIMKTWRETKIGEGIKRPKSKEMLGLNNKENLSKKN